MSERPLANLAVSVAGRFSARHRPWWCDCDSGLGADVEHPANCYGEGEAFPKLNAALRAQAEPNTRETSTTEPLATPRSEAQERADLERRIQELVSHSPLTLSGPLGERPCR